MTLMKRIIERKHYRVKILERLLIPDEVKIMVLCRKFKDEYIDILVDYERMYNTVYMIRDVEIDSGSFRKDDIDYYMKEMINYFDSLYSPQRN